MKTHLRIRIKQPTSHIWESLLTGCALDSGCRLMWILGSNGEGSGQQGLALGRRIQFPVKKHCRHWGLHQCMEAGLTHAHALLSFSPPSSLSPSTVLSPFFLNKYIILKKENTWKFQLNLKKEGKHRHHLQLKWTQDTGNQEGLAIVV